MEKLEIYYLILVHKNADQTIRLIQNLDDTGVKFFIHVDLNSESVMSGLQLYKQKNLFLSDKRFEIRWGGFNIIKATIALIQQAIDHATSERAYFVLLSGQDSPIKKTGHISSFLNSSYGKQFIQHSRMPSLNSWGKSGGMERIHFNWFIDEIGGKKSLALVREQIEKKDYRAINFVPYGGSQWWCLSKQCVEFILDSLKEENLAIYEFFKSTLIPDEMFFQTILLNSSFKKSVANNNLRHIDWKSGPDYPRILKKEDFKVIKRSKKLFARKFDNDICEDILLMIEDKILIK